MRETTITWPGGEHEFKLTIEHLRALQQHCNAGPGFVYTRLTTGAWMVDDIIQPIRLGLEGGGMDKREATELVAKYVEEAPLTRLILTAVTIIGNALYEPEEADEDILGELDGEMTPESRLSPMEKSDGASFTESEQGSDIIQEKSIN